jgi:hypothetical protein
VAPGTARKLTAIRFHFLGLTAVASPMGERRPSGHEDGYHSMIDQKWGVLTSSIRRFRSAGGPVMDQPSLISASTTALAKP